MVVGIVYEKGFYFSLFQVISGVVNHYDDMKAEYSSSDFDGKVTSGNNKPSSEMPRYLVTYKAFERRFMIFRTLLMLRHKFIGMDAIS